MKKLPMETFVFKTKDDMPPTFVMVGLPEF